MSLFFFSFFQMKRRGSCDVKRNKERVRWVKWGEGCDPESLSPPCVCALTI